MPARRNFAPAAIGFHLERAGGDLPAHADAMAVEIGGPGGVFIGGDVILPTLRGAGIGQVVVAAETTRIASVSFLPVAATVWISRREWMADAFPYFSPAPPAGGER